MANSQGSSSTVGTGGYWDEFLNCDDSFYKIMNVLDFPMESVEGNTSFDLEKRMAQFQSLEPMTSEILHGVAPVSTSDSIPNTSLQVQIDPASSSKHMSAGLELIVPVRNRTKIPKTSTFNKWHNQHRPGRRCSHCQAETTPLWREGPSGPKTLCNACGIRYRRLNYYPAVGSPSVATLLSNNQNQVTQNIKPETDST